MSKSTKVAIVVLGLAVIILGFAVFTDTPAERIIERVIEKQIGAVSGPDISSPYLAVNGSETWYNKTGLRQSTSTVCAIKSPSATSTLTFGAVNFQTGTTVVNRITLAKATTAYATTTALGVGQFEANSNVGYVIATSTTEADIVFPPNNYFVVGVRGAISAGDESAALGYVPVGRCTANFIQIR